MRLALFGGAFDPIHSAHIQVGREAARRFNLDRVLFIPTANPPHKSIPTPYEDRYRMVELALEGEPCLEPSRLEAGTGHSYSIDTIERARDSLKPEDQLFFLIGADAFADVRTWVRWRDVIRSLEFIVVSRPGHDYKIPDGAIVHRLDNLDLPVSSTSLRDRLRRGERPAELPGRVLAYIRDKGLYPAPVRQV